MRAPLFAFLKYSYVFLALSGSAFGAESLVLSPGTTTTLQIPAISPFITLGDTRLELRIHGWPAHSYNTPIFRSAGLTVEFRGSGELCALNTMDSMPSYGNTMCADISGKADVIARVQRDVSNKRFRLDVFSSTMDWQAAAYCGTKQNGTSGNAFPCPIDEIHIGSWAGTGLMGGENTNVRVPWIKWFSSLAQAWAAIGENTPADLGDWRFEGSLLNEATGGPKVAMGRVEAGLPEGVAAGGVVYMPSPSYPPVCSAGPWQTLRAGYPGRLDGSGSFPADGSASLAYAWEQVSGPSTVAWSERNTAQPAVTGLVFGSYVFRLTVTDGGGRSTSCSVKHGSVFSDNNGVVITSAPGVDALIGPLIRFGANPWPWFDDRHRATADVQIANLDKYYGAYWDTPRPGTVTVMANSATVTGVDTMFTTTFCQGSGNPTVPRPGAMIIVWFPTATAGQTGRRQWAVASCQNDNQLTMRAVWKDDVPAGSGLRYSYGDDEVASPWAYGPAPVNYYDNVAGLYALYYRSGVDDYLIAARKLADRFWTSPQLDRGAACVLDGPGCFGGRSQSTMGLILRALDGRPEMWTGFHRLWDVFKDFYLDRVDVTWGPGMWDLREEAYHLAMVSYCALYDADPVYRSNCKQSVAKSFSTIWTPYKAADGSWPQFYSAYKQSSWESGSVVTLTQGSRQVTGIGTGWTPDRFSGGYPIWFTNDPSARPADNKGGDPVTYTATFVDAAHLTLDRPYEGTSGTHGWVLADGGTAGLLGWGSQPFMMGILAAAFDLSAKAIADSDPATAALARQYNVTAANWIKDHGYWPLQKGLYYGAGFVNCQAPISDNNAFCTGNNDTGAARVLNAEAIRGIMTAYAASGDIALKTFADTLYSAMFSKPGTGGPNPDGRYIDALEDGTGWYMIGTPPVGQAPKYFGMFFGFNALSAWPAYRVGGPQPGGSPAQAPPDPGTLKGAPRAHATTTPPGETTQPSVCRQGRCTAGAEPR